MSLSRTILFIGVTLLGGAVMAYASGGGSTYSMLGLGDLRYMSGVRSTGMGYTGIGLASPLYLDPMAPATWSRINHVRVDASLFFEGSNSTDGHTSRFLSEMNFAGALMAIPIAPSEGIVMVAGFTPYSNVDYNLATTGSFQSGSDQLDYTLRHVGTGGLGQAELGFSYAPSDIWSFGASANYIFGSINSSTTMVTTRTDVATGASAVNNNIHGVLANVGALYSGFGGFLHPLSVGVSITSPGILISTQEQQFTYTGGAQTASAYDTLELSGGHIKVPIALGFGLSWLLNDRSTFAADYRMQAWGKSDFYGQTPAGIKNSYMAGAGYERAPSRDPSASFWSHLAYRLGVAYNATYYEVNGIPINEWIGTGGISLPLNGETRLNLSGEWAVRGKQSSNLIKETKYRFTVSLTLGELWFVRPEED